MSLRKGQDISKKQVCIKDIYLIKYLIAILLLANPLKLKADFLNSAFIPFKDIHKDSSVIKRYDLATIQYNNDKYAEAFKTLLPLTEIDFEDVYFSAKINLLAGQILIKDKNSLKGLSYLRKSQDLLENFSTYREELFDNNYAFTLADNYFNLSSIFGKMNREDSAKFYLNKVIHMPGFSSKLLGLKAKAHTNMGNRYVNRKMLDSAAVYFDKAIQIHRSLNNQLSLAAVYTNLANIFVEKENFTRGRQLYEKALSFLHNDKSLKAIEYKELLYDNIAWALYNLKDYRAYDYVTGSFAIRDSLNREKLTKDLEEIKAINDVEKARQQEQIKIERQERKTWIIGITGVLVSLLLLYLANLYKLRQQRLSLKLSKSQLEQQRKLERLKLESQTKILNATIDGKETERKQIAEILHDNVSALLSSASMHLQASQKQFRDDLVPLEISKAHEIINEASQKIRDLSHNLMSSVLLKFGLEYAVKEAAKKYSNSHIRINTGIHNVFRYSQEYEIKIFNIIQELINNILKHSEARNAYIIMEEEEACLTIIVKDDGVGFRDKSEEQKGVGINQIKARIHMMNGKFLIESSKGRGTKTIMNIPIIPTKTNVYSA